MSEQLRDVTKQLLNSLREQPFLPKEEKNNEDGENTIKRNIHE